MDPSKLDHNVAELSRAPSSQALNELTLRLVGSLGLERPSADAADAIVDAVSDRLSQLAEAERMIAVPLALPRLLELLDRSLPDRSLYENAERELRAGTGKKFPSPSAFVEFQFNLLMLQSVTKGLDQALAEFVQRLMAAPYANWLDPNIENLGDLLIQHHWLDGPLKATIKAVGRAGKAKLREENVRKLLTLTRVLGFNIAAPRHWLDKLFEAMVLPAIAASTRLRMFDVALRLEWTAYVNYTRAKDDAEHFRDTVGQWAPYLRRCGKAFGTDLPDLKVPAVREGPPKVAFYLHNSQVLGHTEALLSFFRGLGKLDPKPLDALLYIGGSKNPELDHLLLDYGVSSIYVQTLAGDRAAPTEELMAMRRDGESKGVAAFVYVSLVLTMPFAFAMQLAPVQIWWSMKYHSIETPDIDGYLALGSFENYRDIDGRPWRAVHRAMAPLFDPALAGEAAEIRRQLLGEQGTLLLGCVGRAEKMISDAYIAALAEVMGKVPGAVFLWTGKNEHPQVVELLIKHGIADRCRFVGWINTRLYAQVLDIFLDSFPFASGLTAFEAMAAGRPVVSMITREALGTGMPAHVWPVFKGQVGTPEVQADVRAIFTDPDGATLLPFAETNEAYLEIALKLCADEAYRSRVGEAQRAFVDRYMIDDTRMAESGCRHILEIIEETQSAV